MLDEIVAKITAESPQITVSGASSPSIADITNKKNDIIEIDNSLASENIQIPPKLSPTMIGQTV